MYPLATYEIPAQPQKNGNISQLWWRVRGRSAEAWGLEYDYLNRLTQAKHVAVHDGGAKIMGQYSEKITYADARGNIAAIQRYGVIPGASYPSGIIDELSFTMKPGSNQLQRVADGAPTEFAPRGFKPTAGAQNIDYTYDPVGNQTSDPHKGITVTYNYLNLPSVILWSNGNKMEMSYDAMGTKLSKKVSVGATEQYTQHYLGGIEYNAVGTTRKLEAIYFADGRVYNTNVTTASTTVALRYEYAIRDHLGNTRLMFADLDNLGTISSNEILQENHFYPFGMNMEGVWMNDSGSKDSKYLYNGKELNDDFGLNWSDYGARWYDAGIGRWNAVDPLVEKYSKITPYAYVANNPMIFVDPNGELIKLYGTEGEVALIAKHLMMIYATEEGKKLIDKLNASSNVYIIQDASWIDDISYEEQNDRRLTYDADEKTTFNTSDKKGDKAPHFTLTHELKHVEDDEDNYYPMDLAESEERAMRLENYMRLVYGSSNLQYVYNIPSNPLMWLTGTSSRDGTLDYSENFNIKGEKIDGNSVNFTAIKVVDNKTGREFYRFSIAKTRIDDRSNNVLHLQKKNSSNEQYRANAYKMVIIPEK